MKTFAFDVDEVLAQIMPEWLSRYNRDYQDNLQVDQITDWDITKFTKPGSHIYRYLDDPDFYDSIAPGPATAKILTAIRGLGHRAILVTSATPGSMGQKYKWAMRHGLIQSTKDYVETGDKSLICADVLLDDYPGNLINFKGRGVLFDQPWNQDEQNYLRVYSLVGFYTWVLREYYPGWQP